MDGIPNVQKGDRVEVLFEEGSFEHWYLGIVEELKPKGPKWRWDKDAEETVELKYKQYGSVWRLSMPGQLGPIPPPGSYKDSSDRTIVPAEQEGHEAEEWYLARRQENAPCVGCGGRGQAERSVLCDGCDAAYHIFCLKPPLKSIPQGDWFCPKCKPPARPTPSPENIRQEVHRLLKGADLEHVSVKSIRRDLEGHFGTKLESYKDVIREAVDEFLRQLSDGSDSQSSDRSDGEGRGRAKKKSKHSPKSEPVQEEDDPKTVTGDSRPKEKGNSKQEETEKSHGEAEMAKAEKKAARRDRRRDKKGRTKKSSEGTSRIKRNASTPVEEDDDDLKFAASTSGSRRSKSAHAHPANSDVPPSHSVLTSPAESAPKPEAAEAPEPASLPPRFRKYVRPTAAEQTETIQETSDVPMLPQSEPEPRPNPISIPAQSSVPPPAPVPASVPAPASVPVPNSSLVSPPTPATAPTPSSAPVPISGPAPPTTPTPAPAITSASAPSPASTPTSNPASAPTPSSVPPPTVAVPLVPPNATVPSQPVPVAHSFLSAAFLQDLTELRSMTIEQCQAAPPDNPKFRLTRERGIAGSPFAPLAKRRRPLFIFAADPNSQTKAKPRSAASVPGSVLGLGSRTPPYGTSDFLEDEGVIEMDPEPFAAGGGSKVTTIVTDQPQKTPGHAPVLPNWPAFKPLGSGQECTPSKRPVPVVPQPTVGHHVTGVPAGSRAQDPSAPLKPTGGATGPHPAMKFPTLESLLTTLPPFWCCKLSNTRKQYYFYRKDKPQESISWKHPVHDCYCAP